MRVTVNQENLAKALGIVSRAVSSRTTLPVLGNILLSAQAGELKLSATNRQIAITAWIGAKVDHEGAVTIPARLLSEFVNSLPPERVTMDLAVRTQTLRLACAGFTANMKGIDHFEFPIVPTLPTGEDAVLPPSIMLAPTELRGMVDRVTFAASADENRPTLTGVEVAMRSDKITMAATDGFRLAVCAVPFSNLLDDSTRIIPATSLNEASRIAADATEVVMHLPDANTIFTYVGDESVKGSWLRAELVTELIDARYPDYNGTVPKSWSTCVELDTAELLKAIRVAQLFARGNANIVKFSICSAEQKGRGTLTLTATDAEMGDSVNDLFANKMDGDDIDIAISSKYMIDALTHGNFGDLVRLEFTTPTRPAVMHGGEPELYKVITMPLHPPK